MFTHPGAKLLFMGDEFGVTNEWNYKSELQWELLQHEPHRRLQQCVKDLNKLYRELAALHEKQFEQSGFEWVDLSHRNETVIVYKRMGHDPEDEVLVILNMTSVPRWDFEITIRDKKTWTEVFNSDSKKYWGAGDVYNPSLEAQPIPGNEHDLKLRINLPPLGGLILK